MHLIGIIGDLHLVVADIIRDRWGGLKIEFSDRLRGCDEAYLLHRAEVVRKTAAASGVRLMLVCGLSLPREIDWLQRHGGRLIRIKAPGHAVTAPSAPYPVDVIRHDSTLDELQRRVVDLVSGMLEDRAA